MVDRPDDRADLLRELVEGVRRLARHLVRDPHDAEDVAQESLLAAVRRAPMGVRDLGAWLRGIVRHKAVQQSRSEGRRRRHEQDAEHEVQDDLDVDFSLFDLTQKPKR